MIEEVNLDSIAECDQLNLAYETETNASAHLVQYKCKIRWQSGRNQKTMEERICERDEF